MVVVTEEEERENVVLAANQSANQLEKVERGVGN